MELDVVEDAVVTLEVERIAADEEMLVSGEAGHRVAGADAFEPLVGAHADDRRVEIFARAEIPARPERRVEREAVMRDLDRGDFHAVLAGLDPITGPIILSMSKKADRFG